MNYIVREYKEEDNELLELLYSEYLKEEIRNNKNIKDNIYIKKYINKIIKSKNTIVLVAENETKEIIGYLMGTIIDEDLLEFKEAIISSIYLIPQFNKMFIIKELLENFNEKVKSLGIKYTSIIVNDSNAISKFIYDKMGFNNSIVVKRKELE